MTPYNIMIPLVNVTPVPNPSNTIHACSLMRTVSNIDAGHRVPLSSEPRAVARLHLRDAEGNDMICGGNGSLETFDRTTFI